MEKMTFQENLIVRLLTDNLKYEVAGWENQKNDGGLTEKEFDERMDAVNMFEMLGNMLNEAYKKGFLESQQTSVVIEAKHIKFLGNEKIDKLKSIALMNVLVRNI